MKTFRRKPKLFTVEQRKKLLEEELSRIVGLLKRDYEPEKIILFGSLAEGDMHEPTISLP